MMVNDAYANQTINSLKAAELQVEIARFYDATQNEKFGEVTKLMAEARPSEKMDAHADLIRRNQTGKVIQGAQELAEQFKKWADILEPKQDGGGGEGGGEQGEPGLRRWWGREVMCWRGKLSRIGSEQVKCNWRGCQTHGEEKETQSRTRAAH